VQNLRRVQRLGGVASVAVVAKADLNGAVASASVDVTRRRGSAAVVGHVTSSASPSDVLRRLVVEGVIDDLLHAHLAFLQLARAGVRRHVRLELAGEVRLVADRAPRAVVLVAEVPLVAPSHLKNFTVSRLG